jgi:hypothetical protein
MIKSSCFIITTLLSHACHINNVGDQSIGDTIQFMNGIATRDHCDVWYTLDPFESS